MARIKITLLCLMSLLLLAVGCGVKTPPLPSTEVAPAKVLDLKANTVANGVEVSLSVPSADKPAQRIVAIQLYYGYLPITGDPVCPPCLPRLRTYRTFDLTGQESLLMQGGKFVWVDTKAPLGKEANYIVLLKDAAGRYSEPSKLARAPRVRLMAPPKGLKARNGDNEVELFWRGPILDSQKQIKDGFCGYVVYRKSAEEQNTRPLNTKPLLEPSLLDKSVKNGQIYYYSVASASRVKNRVLIGNPGKAIKAMPKDMQAPLAVTDLMAVNQDAGIMLRFTPGAEKDIAGYKVFRKQGKGKWLSVTDPMIVENTFVDKNVKKGATYSYKAQSIDEAGNASEFSEVVKITFRP